MDLFNSFLCRLILLCQYLCYNLGKLCVCIWELTQDLIVWVKAVCLVYVKDFSGQAEKK